MDSQWLAIPSEVPPMGKKLYVGNLIYSVTDDELRSMFEQFGTVHFAQIIMDRDTGRSKVFGFVTDRNQRQRRPSRKPAAKLPVAVK